LTNGKIMRIRPELQEALLREARDSFPGYADKLANQLAQQRVAVILNQTKEVFKLPKFKIADLNLKKCHLKVK
jgi:hypothetical protein